MSSGPTGRGRGRPAGKSEDRRAAVLAAARDEFGKSGYDGATMRSIAKAADVDPSLIVHFFGSKKGLFAAAHQLGDPAAIVDHMAALPQRARAEMLVRFYLHVFTAPNSPALSLLRSAITNQDAAAALREFLRDALLARAPQLARGPNPELQLSLAVSQLLGIILTRQLLELDVITDHSIEEIAELVTPSVLRHLQGRDAAR